MAENFVTVNAKWDDGTGTAATGASGNFLVIASGTLITSPSVAVVTTVLSGQLDASGGLSLPAGSIGSVGGGGPNTGISLLASDNFSLGQLTWGFLIHVEGISDIAVADVNVNYSAGAVQGLFQLLASAGWSPSQF